MITQNEVYLSGKCIWCRYFEPDGKNYTSMWIRVKTPNGQTILVDIPINDKEINGKALPVIRSILESDDAYVFVFGQIVNKKDSKTGKTVTKLKANLRNIEALRSEIGEINLAIVAGDIEKRAERIITIGVPYRNASNNTWKKRNIPVLLPEQGQSCFDSLHRNALTDLANSKRVIVKGELFPKLPNGVELVHILANEIIPIP